MFGPFLKELFPCPGAISSGAGRERIGIPNNWSTVSKWLNPSTKVLFPPSPPIKTQSKKCPDVPVLKSYVTPPPPAFWKAFPSLKLPSHPTSALNYQRLGAIIKGYRSSLSLDQNIRADRVLKDLEHGSAVPFLTALPSARTLNTPSVSVHGEEFTDTWHGGFAKDTSRDLLPHHRFRIFGQMR
jgi:hypothetical protein